MEALMRLPIHDCRAICGIGSNIAMEARPQTPIGENWTSAIGWRRSRFPRFTSAGWYDTYLHGSIAGYLALREHAGSAFARDNQYLLAGPWVHIPWGDRVGEQSLGDAANLDTDRMLLRWFNHWLKDSAEFATEPQDPLLCSWGQSLVHGRDVAGLNVGALSA